MKVKDWFAREYDVGHCSQLHVLRVFERLERALEDCTTEFPIIVGRGTDVDVRITDRTVSRIHCGLSRDRRRVVLTDLESQNGTFVNGQPITQCVLREGDEIRIGSTVMLMINLDDDAVLAIDVKD